jgi:pyruvate/2-oxoglutarate dehydrogenase complex dihydrolipoamide acyltransferase (E2) component
VPHFSCAELVDMTPLKRVRDRLKVAAQAEGVKLSYLPFVLRAVVLGLQQYPALNSRFDGETIQTFSACHLGLAVSVGDGLVVPVIRHAEQQTVKELAVTVQQLADTARAGRLQAADLQGGTFTISNVGAVGACMFGLPIVNAPEVAILAVNQVRKMPMVMTDPVSGQDQLGVGYGMYLSLSADHRVLDGAVAVKFLQAVKESLEAPETLFWV